MNADKAVELVEAITCAADREQVVSFRCYPIKTAPKDRQIYVFDERWYDAEWTNDLDGGWVHYDAPRRMWLAPTHWAEISDMVPAPYSAAQADDLVTHPLVTPKKAEMRFGTGDKERGPAGPPSTRGEEDGS